MIQLTDEQKDLLETIGRKGWALKQRKWKANQLYWCLAKPGYVASPPAGGDRVVRELQTHGLLDNRGCLTEGGQEVLANIPTVKIPD